MGVFTSVLNLFKPATSDFVDVVADLNDNWDKLETVLAKSQQQWVAYTPTWNGTLGNGTLTGEYTRLGKLVFARVNLVFGTTTVSPGGGATNFLFGTPVNARTGMPTGQSIATGLATDAGANTFIITGAGIVSATTFQVNTLFINGANLLVVVVRGNFPFTFANLDNVEFMVIYEAA